MKYNNLDHKYCSKSYLIQHQVKGSFRQDVALKMGLEFFIGLGVLFLLFNTMHLVHSLTDSHE